MQPRPPAISPIRQAHGAKPPPPTSKAGAPHGRTGDGDTSGPPQFVPKERLSSGAAPKSGSALFVATASDPSGSPEQGRRGGVGRAPLAKAASASRITAKSALEDEVHSLQALTSHLSSQINDIQKQVFDRCELLQTDILEIAKAGEDSDGSKVLQQCMDMCLQAVEPCEQAVAEVKQSAEGWALVREEVQELRAQVVQLAEAGLLTSQRAAPPDTSGGDVQDQALAQAKLVEIVEDLRTELATESALRAELAADMRQSIGDMEELRSQVAGAASQGDLGKLINELRSDLTREVASQNAAQAVLSSKLAEQARVHEDAVVRVNSVIEDLQATQASSEKPDDAAAPAKLDEEARAHSEALARLEAEVEGLRASGRRTEEALSAHDEVVARLEAAVEGVRAALAEEAFRTAEAVSVLAPRADAEALANKAATLQEGLDGVRAEVAEMAGQVEALGKEKEKGDMEMAVPNPLQGEVTDLARTVGALQTAFDALQPAFGSEVEMRRLVDESQLHVMDALDASEAKYRTEIEEAKGQIDQQSASLRELKLELEKSMAADARSAGPPPAEATQRSEMEEAVAGIASGLKENTCRIEDLAAMLSDAEAKLAGVQQMVLGKVSAQELELARFDDLATKVEDLQQRLTAAQDAASAALASRGDAIALELAEERQARDTDVVELRAKVDALASEDDRQKKALQDGLASCAEEVADCCKHIGNLRDEVDTKLATLEAELNARLDDGTQLHTQRLEKFQEDHGLQTKLHLDEIQGASLRCRELEEQIVAERNARKLDKAELLAEFKVQLNCSEKQGAKQLQSVQETLALEVQNLQQGTGKAADDLDARVKALQVEVQRASEDQESHHQLAMQSHEALSLGFKEALSNGMATLEGRLDQQQSDYTGRISLTLGKISEQGEAFDKQALALKDALGDGMAELSGRLEAQQQELLANLKSEAATLEAKMEENTYRLAGDLSLATSAMEKSHAALSSALSTESNSLRMSVGGVANDLRDLQVGVGNLRLDLTADISSGLQKHEAQIRLLAEDADERAMVFARDLEADREERLAREAQLQGQIQGWVDTTSNLRGDVLGLRTLIHHQSAEIAYRAEEADAAAARDGLVGPSLLGSAAMGAAVLL